MRVSTRLLLSDIDTENRILTLNGEINDSFYLRFMRGMRLLSSISTTEPITIFLDTEGGDVYATLGMVDFLRAYQGEVAVVVCGRAFSAGAILLQAASKGRRYAMPKSSLMVHFGSEENWSKQEASHNERVGLLVRDLFLERVNVTKRTVNRWFEADCYFTAEEALRKGLIDEIIKC